MKVLITGAAGLVGTALISRLSDDPGVTMRLAARRGAIGATKATKATMAIESIVTGDIDGGTDWARALDGVDAVVHLAARVHQMADAARDPLTEFRRVNTEGTTRLARAAAAAGVARFVFLSTLKVHGESGVFNERHAPVPADPYAISKCEAEESLRSVAASDALDVVIIRPALVYGEGVRANFHSLMRAVARGVPLPFGAVDNRRSLIGVQNLADLIATTLANPHAAGETFLASDGDDVSTPELVRRIAHAMGRPARLVRVPPSMLRAMAAIVGKADAMGRLTGSLAVDSVKAWTHLGWQPPLTLDEGLKLAVAGVVGARSA